MTDLTHAAQSLIVALRAPAQWHSVFIQARVDPETKQFTKHLCVSVRPGCENKVNIPREHMGVPIEVIPWPKEQA